MTTWNPKANDVFLRAMELSAAHERQDYLDAACAGDEPLRAEVEVLLAAGEQAGSFLESPAVAPALLATVEQPIAERPGTMIGPYKLLEQIGEGGFGVVFMAEQTQPVRRKVALKVLKPGMDTRQVVARFEAERQALAIMDHPNIAQVHDGGATPSGRPYFVMELVKGVPITEFCDQNQLTPRERLELFIHVCQAVQHAHQKGIIHRDLKPSNILVVVHDTTPVVKVIDFGVAKALGQELTDKTLFTGFAQMVGTPLYMSPEQAGQSGLDVDTRSDIYSLGVLLYELLTGTTPFTKEQFRAAGYDEIRRIIREEEPPKPSTRISTLGLAASTVSTNRRSDPKHLGRLLRGEVDWIVMKALEKDRNRRYETANGLARDIERYLHDEPVQACPPSAWYRFRKFARRKKIALAMAACVFLALSGIAGGVGWAVRDNAAREEASELDRLAREKALDQVVERSLGEAGPLVEEGRWPEALAIIERTDQLLDAAGRTELPARLVELRKVLAVAQRLEGIYQGSLRGARPRRRMIASPAATTFEADAAEDVYDEAFFWGRQQDADFTKAFLDLGIDVETLSPAEAAEKIRRQSIGTALVRALDGWATFRKRSRGEGDLIWKKLIEIARQADADDWRNRCRAALLRSDRETLEELADAVPVRQTPPESLYLLGQALKEVGAVDKAMTFLERGRREYPADLWLNDALAHFSWSACQPPRWDAALRYYAAVLALRPDFAPVHVNVADALKAKGATEEALLEYSKALELDPKSVTVWRSRGDVYRGLRRYDEAVADDSKAIELEPTNGSAWESRSAVFLEAGKYDSALADAKRAVEVVRERIDPSGAEPNRRVDLGHRLWHLARVLSSNSKNAEAEKTLHEALKAFENLASQYPHERYYRLETAYTLRQLFFDVWQRAHRTDEAVEAMRRAIDLYAALVAEEPRDEFYRSELAITCYDLADYLKAHQRTSLAEPLFQRAIDLRRALIAEGPAGEHRLPLAYALRGLAQLYRDAERLAEAEEAYRAALELGRQIMRDLSLESSDASLFGWAGLELVAILKRTGRAQQADELCRKIAQDCRWAIAREKQTPSGVTGFHGLRSLAGTLESLACLLSELGEVAEAEACFREANAIWRELVADVNSEDYGFHLAVNYDLLGELLRRRGRTDEAVEAYRAARAIWEKQAAEFNHEDRRNHLAWTNQALGELAVAAGRLDDAAAAYRAAADVWQKLAEDFPAVSSYGDHYSQWLAALRDVYVKQGRSEQAEQALTAGVEKRPNQAATWRSRGELFAQWALLPEAAADLAHAYVLQAPGDSVQFVVHALLRAYVGDAAGYREACAQMLAWFADSTNADDWNNVAAALGVSADSGVEPSRAVAFAERAAEENRIVWRVAYLGMAYYRAREFQRAAAALEESLTINANYNPALVYSALAMTRHQLGNPAEAAAALMKARSAWEERVAASLAGGLGHWPGGPWYDTVYAEWLYKEAHTLVHGSPPPDDPRWIVLRGRGLEAIGRAEAARAAFATAFALAPDDLMIRIQTLPPISRADAHAQAIADLRVFWKEHPRQPPAAVLALAQVQQRWGTQQAQARRFSTAAEALVDAAGSYDNLLAQIAERAGSTTSLGVPSTSKDIAWYRHELGYVLTYAGEALRWLGRLSEAETALTRGVRIHESLANDAEAPADMKSRLAWTQGELGMVYQARGLPREAEQKYREVIALLEREGRADNWLGGSYDALAQLCEVEGRTAEAIEAQRKAVATWSQLTSETKQPQHRFRQAWANERLAAMLLRAKESAAAMSAYGEAVEVLEALVREQPDHADHYFNCGLLRAAFATDLSTAGDHDSAQKQFQAAIAAYTKVIELPPDNAVAQNNLAWLFATCPETELRDPGQAVALAKKAVQLRPTEGSGWNTLGAAQYRAGEWQTAVESLTKSMELRSGGDAEDWYFLAMAHCRLGHIDDARKWRQQAVEWEEKNAPLLSGNRQVADELRRFRAEAEELLRQED